MTIPVTNLILDVTQADEEDKEAALLGVNQENQRRADEDPPITPLPTTPDALLWQSYEIVWASSIFDGAHKDFTTQGRKTRITSNDGAYDNATPAIRLDVDTILDPFRE